MDGDSFSEIEGNMVSRKMDKYSFLQIEGDELGGTIDSPKDIRSLSIEIGRASCRERV